MQRISPSFGQPLYSIAATRHIEQQAAAALAPHTLMQRAGLAVARLALALAPHARHIWIACGPGNNGGDGFEAALHLHQWGKKVSLTWTGLPTGKTALPPDAQAARQRALDAGVTMLSEAPQDFDLCIDALLGIGATLDPNRPGSALMQQWLALMQSSPALRLAVDLPSGLNADTGAMSGVINGQSGQSASQSSPARASSNSNVFTLSLLTLKPGLFTASGRDQAGQVWFDDLGVCPAPGQTAAEPGAWLLGADCI
ncbi:MAG: bifunctional ADP-dependent NAD(P)H-hydrate dehydratase/NAD(P)H-hydrate epimerase, partial [Polaromonas sp.]|nr:bifunctional ADP-dependent NAD(P)H-hydrate dehydratase/NAD(P)H-hydrate epimerase [Polaromonas sp.]